MLKRGILAVFAALLCQSALASIVINVNVKNGDVVHGQFTFRVTVQADNLVTQVEFYMGDDLRGTDESTPYEFLVDTLTEEEGEHVLTFAAFTSEGESAKKTIRVKVDNGLGLGIDAHLASAEEALTESRWDDAIAAGRVALKIKPSDNRARLLMARAYMSKGVQDLAQKYAEDVLADEPTNARARDLLSAISLQQAFSTVQTAGSSANLLEAISAAMSRASQHRREVQEQQIAAFGEVNDENRLAYCDLLVEASRYGRAIEILSPVFLKDIGDTKVGNRLVYAQIRAGRFADANKTLAEMRRTGSPDGYTHALRAILLQYVGNYAGSRAAETDAILNDPGNIGVKMMQAYLAMRRGDVRLLSQNLDALRQSEGHSTVLNTYFTALYFLTSQIPESTKAFETALLADPTNYDVYVERANQSIFYSLTTGVADAEARTQRAYAKAFLDAALAAKPESFEALTGMCIIHLLSGELEEAVRWGRAATAAGKEYAAAHVALSAALSRAMMLSDARAVMTQAQKLDPGELTGDPIPSPVGAWQYFYRFGRSPLIPAPRQ